MINDVVNNGFQPRVIAPTAEVAAPAAATAPAAAPVAREASPQSAASTVPAESQLQKAVTKLNEHVQNLQRKLSFSVSAETGRTIIKVYDAVTDELIRQIPPEETIKLAENIEASASNLFIKERA